MENEQPLINKITDLLINLLKQHNDLQKILLLWNFMVDEKSILDLVQEFRRNEIAFNEIKYFNFLNNCSFILHELSENKYLSFFIKKQ